MKGWSWDDRAAVRAFGLCISMGTPELSVFSNVTRRMWSRAGGGQFLSLRGSLHYAEEAIMGRVGLSREMDGPRIAMC